MGTSKSSSGPGAGTPLVPTWVTDPPAAPPPPDGAPAPQATPPPIVPAPEAQRFRDARTNFTRYASSGDRSALGRALSGYVQTGSGGSRMAGHRMAVPKRTAARLLSFGQTAQAQGTAAALRSIGLGHLAGRPLSEIYPQLIDALCAREDGGNHDESIARDALSEAVAEISDAGLVNGDAFTVEELNELFVLYVGNTIFDRVFNDIGQNGITLPDDNAAVLAIEGDVRDLITSSVRDSVGQNAVNPGGMATRDLNTLTDRVYESAWDMIVTRANDL